MPVVKRPVSVHHTLGLCPRDPLLPYGRGHGSKAAGVAGRRLLPAAYDTPERQVLASEEHRYLNMQLLTEQRMEDMRRLEEAA